MAKVIIFGVQDFAQLAKFYLQHDSEHEVVAFSVHKQYLPEGETFEGLPVVAFEDVEETYPASEFKFFAPMSPSRMNKLRESVYYQLRDKGFEMISYISSKATVFPGTSIGDNCFILEDNTIQPFTSIGNNVVLWSGNHIGHHSRIGDHCSSRTSAKTTAYIAPHSHTACSRVNIPHSAYPLPQDSSRASIV